MHILADAELGLTVNHLQQKYGEVEIHSVYPKDGPIVYFTPPAKASELVPNMYSKTYTFALLFFLSLVAYITVKYGYYTKQ